MFTDRWMMIRFPFMLSIPGLRFHMLSWFWGKGYETTFLSKRINVSWKGRKSAVILSRTNGFLLRLLFIHRIRFCFFFNVSSVMTLHPSLLFSKRSFKLVIWARFKFDQGLWFFSKRFIFWTAVASCINGIHRVASDPEIWVVFWIEDVPRKYLDSFSSLLLILLWRRSCHCYSER